MKLGARGNEVILQMGSNLWAVMLGHWKRKKVRPSFTPSGSELFLSIAWTILIQYSWVQNNRSSGMLRGDRGAEVYSSLVLVKVVLCLAVISGALQNLHQCVIENTTEKAGSTHERLWPKHTAGPEATVARAAEQSGVDGHEAALGYLVILRTCPGSQCALLRRSCVTSIPFLASVIGGRVKNQ